MNMQMKPSVRVTETIHGKSSKEGLLEGVRILHDPVASTLGAAGRTVIIEDLHGNPKPTKDGVTVAKAIVPYDSVERMGCEVIKQASLQTAEEAGDGTTTSTVIAKSIFENGLETMTKKSTNYTAFNKGMSIAVESISEFLNDSAVEVSLSNIKNVATISANNDPELGEIIAEAFQKAGEHGVVLMEKSETAETYVQVTEGFELEKGYKSDVFITEQDTNRVEYRNALVLISNTKIERLSQIEPFAEYAIMNNNAALVVVADVDDSVVAALAMNKMKGNLKSVVVEPSHFGVRRKDILKDLAVATGGIMIDEETGDNFDQFTIPMDESLRPQAFQTISEYLGGVRKITVDKNKSVFFNDIDENVSEYIEDLKVLLKNEKNKLEKVFLEERIAKISSSVAVVYVGASSDTERSEKADRVDDAIHATRAALEEGIVAGGGVALYQAASLAMQVLNGYDKSVQAGIECVIAACASPISKVLENADYKLGDYIEVLEDSDCGVNVKTGETGDMIEMGIIDPVKVTKTALKNAVSAASTLLSTSTTIINLRKV